MSELTGAIRQTPPSASEAGDEPVVANGRESHEGEAENIPLPTFEDFDEVDTAPLLGNYSHRDENEVLEEYPCHHT
jgi:hypothetical protein